jgi:hypothetical protein
LAVSTAVLRASEPTPDVITFEKHDNRGHHSLEFRALLSGSRTNDRSRANDRFRDFTTRRLQLSLTSTTMASIYRQHEERIDEAIQSLQGAMCTNIASLAREFDVPMQRLQMRLQGRPSKLGNTNTPTWLTSEQDTTLKITLDRLEATGLPARIPMLSSIANQILRQASAPNAPK